VLVLSAIGLLVYYAVELLEKLAIPWHVSHRAPPRSAWYDGAIRCRTT
jgi:hypothetical protein